MVQWVGGVFLYCFCDACDDLEVLLWEVGSEESCYFGSSGSYMCEFILVFDIEHTEKTCGAVEQNRSNNTFI